MHEFPYIRERLIRKFFEAILIGKEDLYTQMTSTFCDRFWTLARLGFLF